MCCVKWPEPAAIFVRKIPEVFQKLCDNAFQSKNYLLGQWKFGGWWYYYLIAFLVKEPGALTLLLLLSALLLFRKFNLDEFILLIHALVVFVLVSFQTGMNQHYRYALVRQRKSNHKI